MRPFDLDESFKSTFIWATSVVARYSATTSSAKPIMVFFSDFVASLRYDHFVCAKDERDAGLFLKPLLTFPFQAFRPFHPYQA